MTVSGSAIPEAVFSSYSGGFTNTRPARNGSRDS